ncbi:Coronatine-insensitive protein [Actinidia chinensis var. chinensis]|uniref:Coronatine-insensitive protein n=1 Tax=Actinidia chinensis var. chinensis TaxID=1590841 RepID=A0A2R6RWU0_ACTCC|nr:Coronatine-insensitive protein [Actinidia chinensis var. chinensis]
MEEERKVSKTTSDGNGMPDLVFQCVIHYIHDARDRDAVSRVCRRWWEIDAAARKHVTIALCYTTTPRMLLLRFPNLESLKLKAKPRAAMFNLIPEDWGGYVTAWVEEIARSFRGLKELHFRRMIVRDSDLELLARARGPVLQSLKLDKCSGFSTDGLLHIGQSCKYTRNVIGNRGLEVLARCCKSLRRLRIERGADEPGMEDERGLVSHSGLMALAQGCLELQYLAVYVSDITNASLEYFGRYSKNLCDFRLVLLEREGVSDLPLDDGVRTLLQGCNKLRRFALYLRPGGLTDVGLGYIGKYSPNVKWMLLGSLGESDAGLLEFSKGCPSLQKLEIRCCCFSEQALAISVLQLRSLRYLWVQGYKASKTPDLLAMARPFWNIELIPERQVLVADPHGAAVSVEDPAHILAYYSLAGPRTDFPDTVVPLEAAVFLNA